MILFLARSREAICVRYSEIGRRLYDCAFPAVLIDADAVPEAKASFIAALSVLISAFIAKTLFRCAVVTLRYVPLYIMQRVIFQKQSSKLNHSFRKLLEINAKKIFYLFHETATDAARHRRRSFILGMVFKRLDSATVTACSGAFRNTSALSQNRYQEAIAKVPANVSRK